MDKQMSDEQRARRARLSEVMDSFPVEPCRLMNLPPDRLAQLHRLTRDL